jgi:hypothetical protein
MKYIFKIMNFRPYEHELLQQKLNRLGQLHYSTDDLSFLSIFKKTDTPVYYKIDFFTPKGKNKADKKKSKELFYDPYLDEFYQPIYNKKGMYVFIGDHEIPELIKWEEKQDFIDDKKRLNSLNAFVIALLVTIFFIVGSLYAMNIDTFLTYGITIAYIGLILALCTTVFRTFCNLFYTHQFYKQLQVKKHQLPQSTLSLLRKIYIIFTVISVIFIAGGMIEDTLNAQSFTIQEHPLLTLNNLGISGETKLSTQKKSSFTVPNSYSSLETAPDNSLLYLKEYQLHSEQSASQLMHDFKKQPDLYLCTSAKIENNVLYGYSQKDLTTLIIQNKNQVILVSYGFIPNETQIQTTIQYYQK